PSHLIQKKSKITECAMQTLQTRTIQAYGVYLLCVQIFCALLITWNLTMTLLYRTVRGIILVNTVYISISNFQTLSAQLHERSTELIKKRKNRLGSLYQTKFWSSCRSIRV